MGIKNIVELRDFALHALGDLKNGNINIQQAATAATLCASVISTIKTQLDYFKAIDEKPQIEFLDCAPVYSIETTKLKQIGNREDDE